MRARLLAATAGILLLAMADEAGAHDRSVSYATWIVDPAGVEATLRVDGRDFTRIPAAAQSGGGADAAVAVAVADSIATRRGGSRCRRATPVSRQGAAGGRVTLRWRLDCPGAGVLEIESRLHETLRTAHLCFVRVQVPGTDGFEVVLHADRPAWQQPEPGSSMRARGMLDSFLLGVRHIAGGTDHLFFVFGLVVVAASLGEVATVITAFTFAHTLTLAIAGLGLLRPSPPSVEALIAASIALLAVENLSLRTPAPTSQERHPSAAAAVLLAPALLAAALGLGNVPLLPLAGVALFAVSYLGFAGARPSDRRVRWLVAFVFGLLHGFGFAGALVGSGFSGAAVAATLVSFNAGVEAGQLLFVVSLWPLLTLARRFTTVRYGRLVVEPASTVLLAASVAWYATRAFG